MGDLSSCRFQDQKGTADRLRQELPCITAAEFVGRFKYMMQNHDARFAFFLGAGCSISSGIPAAAELTETWLRRVYSWSGTKEPYAIWSRKEFPGYNPHDAAKYYASVIDRYFPYAAQRQMEIENIIEGKIPGFGYAVLARLLAKDNVGGRCNFVLTTNFDDLVSDACYLYNGTKPLVIAHHSLCSFVEITRTRPLVLKLHGDARIEPLNTDKEAASINQEIGHCVNKLAREVGIIFIGYGGNDSTISEILSSIDVGLLRRGLYWVNESIPDTPFGSWLYEQRATWVRHRDFDQLMALMWAEFGLDQPDYERFDILMRAYRNTFERLVNSVENQPKGADKQVLSAAVNCVAETSDDWKIWTKYALGHRNLTEARRIFEAAMKKFPSNASLINSYANFLGDRAHEYALAEHYYNEALRIDPECLDTLTDYAVFLEDTRQNNDKAEALLLKAEEVRSRKGNVCFEIEQTIMQDDNVERVIVVLRPEPDSTSTPCAFVQLKDDAEPGLTPHDIITFCRNKLVHFKCPTRVILGNIPMTDTGKVNRHYLIQVAKKYP